MSRRPLQIYFGALVLLAGVVLLLEASSVLDGPRVLWAVLLAAASGGFWYLFAVDRREWWAAIPGAALAGAAVVTVMELDPVYWGQWTEVPFLGALAIGFFAVYLRDTGRWWALIPGGALLTLSVVTAAADASAGPVTAAILLFGLSLTFVLVATLPGGASRRWWAWIPAGVLAVVAVVVLLNVAEWFVVLNYLWPVLVIGAGVFLIGRAVRRSQPGRRDGGRNSSPPEHA
ncbi:hypothetical protein [Ruicaihuangia caeni]|uniref:hypothetical protein n=1 Tax=Ruicaihuangia caeni TaxID=3042517 RepID=UPI00338F50FB